MSRRVMLGVVLLLPWVGCAPNPAVGQDDFASSTRALIASAQLPWARWPDFGRYVDDATRLYAIECGGPVWLDGLRVSAPGFAAIEALLNAGQHGLDPRDYDADVLDRVARHSVQIPLSIRDRARFDLLLSVNLIRFLDDLQSGRLHPRTLDRGGLESRLDLVAAIKDAIAGDSIPRLVAATAPQLAQYRNLQRILARYRALGLAEWVLRDQPAWPRNNILAAQRDSSTTRALLTRPMPVIIFYTTAVAIPDGSAWFYADIYGHDRELDDALRAGPITP